MNCVSPKSNAFTLIELLLVIAIIGLLTAIGLPAIRGMTKSNSMIASNRQFLDELSYARQRAISDHTTVYMAFVPPEIVAYTPAPASDAGLLQQYTNLLGGQYTSYALLSLRQIGDQPGRGTPRYLTPWRHLPNGVFIATNKFSPSGTAPAFPVLTTLPFPNATNFAGAVLPLPYLAFNYLGQLVYFDNNGQQQASGDFLIPLAKGSIFYARDANGNLSAQPADVVENPPNNSVDTYNIIHITGLTGRAKLETQQIQ